MPVIVVPMESSLQIHFVTGTDPETGAPIINRDTFSHVKDTAADQDVFDVANQIVTLQKDSLDSIYLEKNSQLTS